MGKKLMNFTAHREAWQHQRLYLSNLRTYIIVLLTPLIVSFVFYTISINETQNYALQINNGVLQSASETINLRLQEVDNIANEIINNTAVRYFQANTHGFQYPYSYRINEARNALSNYSLTQHFISDYFLFFNNSRIVLNGKMIYQYEDFFKNYFTLSQESTPTLMDQITGCTMKNGLLPVQEITLNKATTTKTTTGWYLMRVQPMQGHNDGYLLILINQDSLLSMFESINLGNNGAIFILNSENQLLCNTELEDGSGDLFASLSARMAEEPDASAFYLNSPNGKMLVNRFHSDALTYISVQPLEIILARVNIYRNLMIGCLIFAILVGSALSVWQAKRISSPISAILHELGIDPDDSSEAFRSIREMIVQLQDNNKSLFRIATEHKALLRSSFASRLLQGGFSNEAEAARVCEYVLPGYADFQSSRVVLLRLEAEDDGDSDDVNLKMLASMKIALKNEIDNYSGKSLYYDVDEKTLAWILFNLEKEEINDLYRRFCHALPTNLQQRLFAFGGGAITQSLSKITRSYEQARTAMLVQPETTAETYPGIYWMDNIPGKLQYFLPNDIHNSLIEALHQGDGEAVTQILDELFRVNFRERPIPYQLHGIFISELLSVAMSCLPMLTSKARLSDEAMMERIEKISAAQPQEQQTLIYKLFNDLAKSAKDGTNEAGKQLIQQVTQYLKTHFQECDLSLTSISDNFGVNISSLSTAFKQQTGKNLSSYLEDLRILEAQHLLRTTNLTINQIAEKVGYPSANTFCRAFRRNTGYNTSTYKAMLQRQNP
ncbi:MAG TPA: AraC family transcriptional regulator [Candidatus Limiplasma sp.]|nr:AraC family transcriptional regulator [Candidatus Limiplasma sp.]